MKVAELLEAIGHGQDQSTVEIHTVYGERMRVTGVELDVREEVYGDDEAASDPKNFIVVVSAARWDDRNYAPSYED